MESKEQNGSEEPWGQDRNKDADVENGLEAMGRGRVSWDEVREWH